MAKSGSRMSFRKGSISSTSKLDLFETSAEKPRLANTRADPWKALNEAQPVDVANADSTMGTSIRKIQHRDLDGNVISDPDRSNPTRPRLERPLDTIRAFEAAVDGSFNRRHSFRTNDSPSIVAPPGRRTTHYNNYMAQHRRGNDQRISSYGSRSVSDSRPGSVYDQGHSSHYNSPRRFGPASRNSSEPALYAYSGSAQQQPQPHHTRYHSHEPTSSGSNSADPWNNSTDPSSEDSSLDRLQPLHKPDHHENYNTTGYASGSQYQQPIYEEQGQTHGSRSEELHPNKYSHHYLPSHDSHQHSQHAHVSATAPATPPKAPYNMAGNFAHAQHPAPSSQYTSTISHQQALPPVPSSDKRQSWIKKRFSRS